MRNTGLEEAQAGIKIARKNINNLRYVDNSTLIVECEEKLKKKNKPLDGSERRERKYWLKAQHSKTKITASGPIASWEIDGEIVETVADFYLGSKLFSLGSKLFWGAPKSLQMVTAAMKLKRLLLLGRKAMTTWTTC